MKRSVPVEQNIDIDYNRLLALAIKASVNAGAAIMKIYTTADFSVEMKADNSPLTLADIASHECIERELNASGVPLLSEEGSEAHAYEERKNWTRCWIVDPLDGTKEFIKRNGEFTVNIAYVESGLPVFGVIYIPAADLLYFNIPGNGSYKVEKATTHNYDAERIFSSATRLPVQKYPETYTMAGSRSHSSPETEAYVEEMKGQYGDVEFVSAGSSLKFCLVAEGKAHSYPRFAPTMEWDTAAGHAILEGAGGSVVTWPDRGRLTYNRENLRNGWFLAKADL